MARLGNATYFGARRATPTDSSAAIHRHSGKASRREMGRPSIMQYNLRNAFTGPHRKCWWNTAPLRSHSLTAPPRVRQIGREMVAAPSHTAKSLAMVIYGKPILRQWRRTGLRYREGKISTAWNRAIIQPCQHVKGGELKTPRES